MKRLGQRYNQSQRKQTINLRLFLFPFSFFLELLNYYIRYYVMRIPDIRLSFFFSIVVVSYIIDTLCIKLLSKSKWILCLKKIGFSNYNTVFILLVLSKDWHFFPVVCCCVDSLSFSRRSFVVVSLNCLFYKYLYSWFSWPKKYLFLFYILLSFTRPHAFQLLLFFTNNLYIIIYFFF